MAWSTRELADLAGTTLRSVRHYHEVGLLPEPERRTNGYKQYGVSHLVRLLRVKRLVDLGFSLAQIADLGDGDEHPADALRTVDADLALEIERLQGLRAELAAILEGRVPTDLPPELTIARDAPISPADRTLVTVMGRLLDEQGRRAYAGLLTDEARSQSDQDFDDLVPEADEATRQELAARMVEDFRALSTRYPEVTTLALEAPVGARRLRETLNRAMVDVYHPAQLDVLARFQAELARTRSQPASRAEADGQPTRQERSSRRSMRQTASTSGEDDQG